MRITKGLHNLKLELGSALTELTIVIAISVPLVAVPVLNYVSNFDDDTVNWAVVESLNSLSPRTFYLAGLTAEGAVDSIGLGAVGTELQNLNSQLVARSGVPAVDPITLEDNWCSYFMELPAGTNVVTSPPPVIEPSGGTCSTPSPSAIAQFSDSAATAESNSFAVITEHPASGNFAVYHVGNLPAL